MFDVPKATVKAVDDCEVPRGYKREGTRERSFMYSLGVYVVPVKEGDNLFKPNRSRMDTYLVERTMFLKANYEHIPDQENIPMVAAKNIRACLPERFSGKDTDLVAAEAAFDVLTNTAAPSARGIGLDED